MTYRNYTQAATTSALSWTLSEDDSFNAVRIDLMFGVAPTTAENIIVTIDSVSGAAYDRIIQTIDPIGKTVIMLNPVVGLVRGDKIVVAYTNTDGRSITGSATLDVRPLTERGGMLFGNGIVRSPDSNYNRYRDLPIGQARPADSGATWQGGTSSLLCGWKQDAATEYLWIEARVHNDWDQKSNPVVEIMFTVNAAGTDAAHTVDFDLLCYYGSENLVAIKTQTVSVSKVIGVCDQYTRFRTEFEIDYDATDNNITVGDTMSMRLSCLASGDVTDVTVNHTSFWYKTTHIGVEDGDA